MARRKQTVPPVPPLQQFLHQQQPEWCERRNRWEVTVEGERFWFDEQAADHPVTFIETFCTLPEGNPFLLEPEQKATVRCLFGWKRDKDNLRRFRELFLFVASGYGKSMLFSAILLYLLFVLAPPQAEMYNIAADVEQARPIFQSSVGMVDAMPCLASRCEVWGRNPGALRRSIVHRNGAFYQVLSSTVHAKHGKRIFAVAIDEEHVLPGDGRELVDTLSKMAKKHRESMVLKATTAGFNQDHVCFEDFQHAKAVRDGVQVDIGFLPVLYYPDEKDPWDAPETWRKANPNLGKSIPEDAVAAEARQAKDIPSRRNQFERLRNNRWTENESIWIPVDEWDACEGGVPFSPSNLSALEHSLHGQACFGGLDLSTNLDLTALARLFPPSSTPQAPPPADSADATATSAGEAATHPTASPVPSQEAFRALFTFWVPKDNVTNLVTRHHLPKALLEWTAPCHCHRNGDPLQCTALVHTTPGNVIQYDFVRKHIKALNEVTPFTELAVDKWGATQIITQLTGDFGEDRVIAVSQGFPFFTPPMRDMERWVLARQIRHGAHPVARWMMQCMAAKLDPSGGIRPVKVDRQKSNKRIDGQVALLNAASRAILHMDQPEGWVTFI